MPRSVFLNNLFWSAYLSVSLSLSFSGLGDVRFSENPRNPYSDQKLADLLKAKDMEISRRTVAKYRDELGIAATTVRKRY